MMAISPKYQRHCYRPCSLAKQGDKPLGSVRLSVSVCPSICPLASALKAAAKSNEHNYQSKVIGCVSVVHRADAGDQLLIIDIVNSASGS